MRGAVWMVSMRWLLRGLGLISTVILARILVPEDFGLVAMAFVVSGFAATIFNLGTDAAILRDKAADRDDIDTAWTIRVGQGALVALAVLGCSFLAGEFFGDPRVETIIQVAAIATLVHGFENIGVVLFRKEFDYRRDFQFNIVKKIVSVVASVSLALLLRNYWALVLATVITALSATVVSYVLSGYRPRFCLRKFRKIFGFSQWMLVLGLGHFVQQNGDRLLIARLSAAADLGVYTVAKEIAKMATHELTLPITRALYPALAQLADDLPRFSRAFRSSLGGAMALAAPGATGLALVAPHFIPVLLGPGWDAAIPFLQLLTFAGLAQVYCGLCGNALVVLNRMRIVNAIIWGQAALILAGMVIAFRMGGVAGVPYALLVANTAAAIALSVALFRSAAAGPFRLLACLWRPAAASAAMALIVQYGTATLVPDAGHIVTLLVQVTLGAASYSAATMALWLVAGRGDCLEARVWSFIADRSKPLLGALKP